jgi:hypothetical protein
MHFPGDFLMAVVIYPLVGATVFVACMALSFFVSGLLLSLIFGQMFIGDWWASSLPIILVCSPGGRHGLSNQRTHAHMYAHFRAGTSRCAQCSSSSCSRASYWQS